jgi:resuscitation-promoting factor RpfB
VLLGCAGVLVLAGCASGAATGNGSTVSQGQVVEATASPTPTASRTPVVETRQLTETQEIPFTSKTVNDGSLAKGTQKIRTAGVPGLKELTFEVTLTDGVETSRRLLSEKVAKAPVTEVVAVGTKQAAAKQCDPNYSGACVPIASDVDCEGGSGNGPAYVRGPVTVIGTDIYDLDHDNDGTGCE